MYRSKLIAVAASSCFFHMQLGSTFATEEPKTHRSKNTLPKPNQIGSISSVSSGLNKALVEFGIPGAHSLAFADRILQEMEGYKDFDLEGLFRSLTDIKDAKNKLSESLGSFGFSQSLISDLAKSLAGEESD
eukprot:TRINITY_DN9973_c0_g1_i1.p1 TRINITY_DN9973_c0_g1~~TRINITY_DN9973_c0_g1_i1.p1  ORF type:complete len:132 (-),score=33.51 TRINITY_DN9973_c0_g1_i1:69-464(-)